MKKEITNYINYLEAELTNSSKTADFTNDILVKISFYQHERLIHLIITLFVGLMAFIFLICFLNFNELGFLLVFLLTLILFLFYILHYYFLENSIQKLYTLYDKAKK